MSLNSSNQELINNPEKITCKYCKKNFQNISNRIRHEKKICYPLFLKEEDKNKEIKKEELKLKVIKEKQLKTKDDVNKLKLVNENLKLRIKLEKINGKDENINNQLINIIADNKKTIEELKNKIYEKEIKEEIIEIKKEEIIISSTTSLTLNNVVIISRSEDNYINATQLCQAGGKKFSHWYSLDTTKELISLLESNAGIPALNLVEVNKGGNHIGSWIHPDLAIQLAQWISPVFALQVSSWIRQLLTNGKVGVDIKLLKEKDNKIKLLQDTYVKRQEREKYSDNVVYLITSEDNKKKRIYIVGIAVNLTQRLTSYNKSSEHEVIYFKSCESEENMELIEKIILGKLKPYREKANRDRFILPIDKEINFFTDVFDETLKFILNK